MIEPALASRLAAQALACVEREFPYQPAHVVEHAADVGLPRVRHPAFYGCFDWHSAVHGHWLLAHLLRHHPALPEAARIRRVLEAHLAPEKLRAEAAYVARHPLFERPYGWAWALKLALELRDWPPGAMWQEAMAPLAEALEARYRDWLPRQSLPVRHGTHGNTAFGLAFALDWAGAAGRAELASLIVARSRDYFEGDRDCPAGWEPSGHDFLSPALAEADLMRRVLPDFASWFDAFLPALPASLAEPVAPADATDGQLAHLDGLNLSRAAHLRRLAAALPTRRAELAAAAARHRDAGLARVASGHYAGEHWLASFAAFALSED